MLNFLPDEFMPLHLSLYRCRACTHDQEHLMGFTHALLHQHETEGDPEAKEDGDLRWKSSLLP